MLKSMIIRHVYQMRLRRHHLRMMLDHPCPSSFNLLLAPILLLLHMFILLVLYYPAQVPMIRMFHQHIKLDIYSYSVAIDTATLEVISWVQLFRIENQALYRLQYYYEQVKRFYHLFFLVKNIIMI